MAKAVKPDKYGLMPGERELLEEDQGHMCAICGGFPVRVRLHVDHHHACARWDKRGSVRGLLCHLCNRGLFRESPALLRVAADYFEKHRCSPKPPPKRLRSPRKPANTLTGPGQGVRISAP